MFTAFVALVAAGALGSIQADSQIQGFPAHARIADDSAHQQFVITLGPVNLPAHAEHHMVEQLGVQAVTLPRGGWMQGYNVEIVDSAGRALPRTLIHHVELIELDRRALLDGQVQRMASVGKETREVQLPGFIGYPVHRGEAIAINPMLDNPTDTAYPAAYIRLLIPYAPENAEDRPVDVYSIGTDVTGAVGRSSDFDIPAGRSSLSHEFIVPISGALLAVGGHLHDLGTRLVLVNLTNGDTVYDARAARFPGARHRHAGAAAVADGRLPDRRGPAVPAHGPLRQSGRSRGLVRRDGHAGRRVQAGRHGCVAAP